VPRRQLPVFRWKFCCSFLCCIFVFVLFAFSSLVISSWYHALAEYGVVVLMFPSLSMSLRVFHAFVAHLDSFHNLTSSMFVSRSLLLIFAIAFQNCVDFLQCCTICRKFQLAGCLTFVLRVPRETVCVCLQTFTFHKSTISIYELGSPLSLEVY